MNDEQLQTLIDQLERTAPVTPAPGFHVFVASESDDDATLRCKEYPIIGWQCCDNQDGCLERLCLQIWSTDKVMPICRVQSMANVFAVKVFYSKDEPIGQLETWSVKQTARWGETKTKGTTA